MSTKLKQDISIGPNLKKHRIAAGFSQERAAARLQVQGLDISRAVLSQMECGKYSIRVSALLALADLYHVAIQDFFADIARVSPL